MAIKENISLLTKYQIEVLFYKCTMGASHAEIAEILGREVNTIQYHMSKIYKTLGIAAPGKTKEEMDSELKNEICPIIRKMFPSLDQVKIWAPSKKTTPSVEKILRQSESQPPVEPPGPTILVPPPPGRPRTNWRQISLWVVISLFIFFVWRNYPQISAFIQGPTNTPVLPPATQTPTLFRPTSIPTRRPTVTATVTPTVTFTPTVTPAPTASPTPTPIVIVTQVSSMDGMLLVYVPAGEFKMGSSRAEDPETREEELPQHIVYLDDYWIDQTEVTNAQYAMCVADAGACTKPIDTSSLTRSSYYDNSLYASYPVIFVSWSQAATYCAWAGRRLPTEAEWEKAARGPDGLIYPWGNTFAGTMVNYCDINCGNPWSDKRFDDGFNDTSPVGDYPAGASVYGAFDMVGNIYEWVADWYAPYSRTNQENPTGPASGNEHILRGGSWGDDHIHVRSAVRSSINDPDFRTNFIGFRCAR